MFEVYDIMPNTEIYITIRKGVESLPARYLKFKYRPDNFLMISAKEYGLANDALRS